MKRFNLDKLVEGFSAWMASGTVVEDLWLILRRPYWRMLGQLGWSCWIPLHQAQKRLGQRAGALYPHYHLSERMGQGMWPWLLLLGPWALILILTEASTCPFDQKEVSSVALAVMALLLALSTTGVLWVLGEAIKGVCIHTPDGRRLFSALIRRRGLIPAASLSYGVVLVGLYGCCFRGMMQVAQFHAYSNLALVMSLTAVVVLVVVLIRTYQFLGQGQTSAVLANHSGNQLLLTLHELLLGLTVATDDSSLREVVAAQASARLSAMDLLVFRSVPGHEAMVTGREALFITAAAFVTHETFQQGYDAAPAVREVNVCLDQLRDHTDLVGLVRWPGFITSAPILTDVFTRALQAMDEQDPDFSQRRRDFLRFALLHQLQRHPEAALPVSGQHHEGPVLSFLTETAHNHYLLYAFYEHTTCGLTEEQIEQAQNGLLQMLS